MIEEFEEHLAIQLKTHVVVTYGRSLEISVTVSEAIAKEVCGACGAIRAAETQTPELLVEPFNWTPIHFSQW